MILREYEAHARTTNLKKLSSNLKTSVVVQDYFTKWVEAIQMPDQTALHISRELVKIFLVLGIPKILHSANFESTLLR